LIFLFILSIIGGIIVLNNLTIAENWFGLNEYQVVETRHQIIRLFPYFWVAGILLVFLVAKNRHSIGYSHCSCCQ